MKSEIRNGTSLRQIEEGLKEGERIVHTSGSQVTGHVACTVEMPEETHLAGWWKIFREPSFEAGGSNGWCLLVTLSSDYSEGGKSLLPGRQGHFRNTLSGLCYSLGVRPRGGVVQAFKQTERILLEDFGATVGESVLDSSRGVGAGTLRTTMPNTFGATVVRG